MEHFSIVHAFIFRIYRAVPFIFELKTICDWTFSHTSLNLLQWIKVEDSKLFIYINVHATLYLAKCNAYYFGTKEVGKKTPSYVKFFVGFCGICLMVILIFGPMILFSSLNPIAQPNQVVGANIELGLMDGSNYYPLYLNSHISGIHVVEEREWLSNNFNSSQVLDKIDRS